jgi:putative drug exporter of the RND superfamily
MVLTIPGSAMRHSPAAAAFVVRMTHVPAVMALLGRRAWALPRRLERIVPEVDIEGERLAKGLSASPSPS